MELKFPENKQVVSANIVFEILRDIQKTEDDLDRQKEHLWAIGLNTQNQIKYIDLVHMGSIKDCPCHPIEIYRRACIKGISALIVAHNHPSGNPEPSLEDRTVTNRLSEAGSVLGIALLDHVIVGKDRFFSFCDEGEL